MDITNDVYTALLNSTQEIQKGVQEQTELEEKAASGRYSAETVKNEIRPRIDVLRRQTRKLSEQAIESARGLVATYRAKIDARNDLDPSEITDDIRLLQCGVPLTARDVEAILKRSENNHTMQMLAIRYAEQHDLRIEHCPFTFELETKAARDRADALDQTLLYYQNWIDKKNAVEMLNRFFAVK